MLVALADATAAVIAAAVGAAVALITTLIERFLRQKPPWHDELLNATAEFLAEAKALQSIAVRLDPAYKRAHHRIEGEARVEARRAAEGHLFKLRAIYQQIVILGPFDAQRHGRNAIEHAWNLIEVYGYNQPDKRRPEWADMKPEDRLEDALEKLAVSVRTRIRVLDRNVVYTRAHHAEERAVRQRLVAEREAREAAGQS